MTEVTIKPPSSDVFYVTIDGTRAIDSLAIGQLWQKFGWKNLLGGLNASTSDADRRTDTAHAELPIRFATESQQFVQKDGSVKTGNSFADIVIMPEGRDGEGVDAGNWPSSSSSGNVSQINAANTFIQGFILAPSCDPAASALGSGARVADLVYVSSHGVRTGDMFGTASNAIDEVEPFFILAKAAATGGKFVGVKWLILSNCNTLVKETQNDWLTLMSASTTFRGILGYHGTSVAADPSSGADVTFAKQLAAGKSLKDAWRQANTNWGMADRWVVVCHDAAKDDTIAQWNGGTLSGVSFTPAPAIKLFDENNLSGVAVTRSSDPFQVFWSIVAAGTPTKITPANRYDKGNKIKPGSTISITVASAPKVATFAAGTVIEVTLIFVREDYPEPIDVTKMFTITTKTGIDPTVTTARRNTQRSDKGVDTWVMTVTSAAASVTLGLTIQSNLFLGDVHHNLPFWLKAKFTAPDGTGVPTFDFIHDAAIYSA
jgi:Family of unknown function (DUF6345)